MNISSRLATRTEQMKSSAVRDILKVVQSGKVISLAGGIPAPDSFPLALMEELFGQVISKYGADALQYDASEGFGPLREALSRYVRGKGIDAAADDVVIFSGSQGILDNLAKVLISPGDLIAVEAPTYLGAISAFNAYEPAYAAVAMDELGMIPESLDEVLANHRVKFIYTVSNFQNPTGRTIPQERRQQIAQIIQRHDALLVEDDPYGDLRYVGETVPSIKAFAPEHVVYNSSLSKIFAPGLRIGFSVVSGELRNWLTIARQGVDLHTSTLNQALSAEYLSGGHLEQHLPHIIELYRPKQLAMLQALDRYFPEGYEWTQPEGGMFIWVEGPEGVDTEEVYWRAIESGVAFVPGKFFYTTPGAGNATMRLNFTMASEETIDQAVRILGHVLGNP